MKDEFKRKTMSNNSGEFNGVYRNADLYGAGHTKRINEQKRKENRRARRSMKQDFERVYLGEWSVVVPEQYADIKDEIERCVNENVEWGCCGGCI